MKILFVKDVYVHHDGGGTEYQFSLAKEEAAFSPPILNTLILMSNGQEFYVERITQDFRKNRFIVFYNIIIQSYDKSGVEKVLNKQLEKGWVGRKEDM